MMERAEKILTGILILVNTVAILIVVTLLILAMVLGVRVVLEDYVRFAVALVLSGGALWYLIRPEMKKRLWAIAKVLFACLPGKPLLYEIYRSRKKLD